MKHSFITAFVLLLVGCTQHQLPYQDSSLSPEQRAQDLLGRLTIEEKAQLMEHGSPAIERLDIPEFNWWSEALHGVARNGTATVFPITVGMAASFDEALVEKAFDAASDEARAKNTIARHEGRIRMYQGLSFWTPNINIFRDPRWGRGQETYGEDPYLTTQMGLAVVRGLQGPTEGHKYRKLLACAKHFAVHSGPEWNRHSFNVKDLPERDLWETYLPAFKALVQEGDVQEVMCAYQSIDDEPCCGNKKYLQQILRNEWGFKGLVTSDCWAINDFWNESAHHVDDGVTSAISHAVISGTDLECGNAYKNLAEAVKEGKLTEEQMDASLMRLLVARFELGDFDPDNEVEWRSIGEDVIASKEHKEISLQLARESMVLLENKNNTLPLSKDMNIVVMGPNANDSIMLWGNYNGFPTETATILNGIMKKAQNVTFMQGCGHVTRQINNSWFDKIMNPSNELGLYGKYWNNQNMEGKIDAQRIHRSALSFDNGGATAFVPNINIEDFSAVYNGHFSATEDDEIGIFLKYTDHLRFIVNSDTLVCDWDGEGTDEVKDIEKFIKIEAGKDYAITIEYAQNKGRAMLHFDFGHRLTYTDKEILNAVKDADAIVFAGGISPRLEGEEMEVDAPGFKGGDRTDIELPKVQRDMIAMLKKAGKKVVYVNCSGSAMALEPEAKNADAILQAWYAGEQGGQAVADVLFGDYNPSGKLPMTFYRNVAQLPDFEDYTMKGRTYRYFEGTPLYAFGYGKSYTTFDISNVKFEDNYVIADVENTGKMDGAETVQVYIKNVSDAEGPQKTLRAYQRVELKAGEKKNIKIFMPCDAFDSWDVTTGRLGAVAGKYQIMVGNSSLNQDLKTIEVDRN